MSVEQRKNFHTFLHAAWEHLDTLARHSPGELISFIPRQITNFEGWDIFEQDHRPMHGIYIKEIDKTMQISDMDVRPWKYASLEDKG